MHLIEWKSKLCYPWRFLSFELWFLLCCIRVFIVWRVPFLYSKLLIYWWGTWCSSIWWLYDIWCALDMLCDLSRCYVVCAINAAWSFMGTKSYRPYQLCDLVCAIWVTTWDSCMLSSHDTLLWWFSFLLCIDDVLLSFLCWDGAFLLLFMILICIVVFISTHWVFIYTQSYCFIMVTGDRSS